MNKLREKIVLKLSKQDRKSLIWILSEFIESHRDRGNIYEKDINSAKMMLGVLIE